MTERRAPRVLIVEDDASVRRLLTMILRRQQIESTAAEDGLAAMDCLRATTFDLMLLDLMMPRMDGLALLDELARGTVAHDGAIIVMTAAAEPLVARLDGKRVQAVLRKPFDVDQLANLVTRMVAAREADP